MDKCVVGRIEWFNEIILEYTYEGYLYLYDEQADNMKLLHTYLSRMILQGEVVLFRQTDWAPLLNAKAGDAITVDRVSSWSRDDWIVGEMYDTIESVLLILESFDTVRGLDVSTISTYKDEHEILLTPSIFHVLRREGNTLWVRLEHNV